MPSDISESFEKINGKTYNKTRWLNKKIGDITDRQTPEKVREKLKKLRGYECQPNKHSQKTKI